MSTWHVYLLLNSTHTRTYVGATIDPIRRLRQHNQEIVGGARATSNDTWIHSCIIYGFPDERSALQFEWMWKYMTRKEGRSDPIKRRYKALQKILESGHSSSASIPFSEYQLEIEFLYPLRNIDNEPEVFKKYIRCGHKSGVDKEQSLQTEEQLE